MLHNMRMEQKPSRRFAPARALLILVVIWPWVAGEPTNVLDW